MTVHALPDATTLTSSDVEVRIRTDEYASDDAVYLCHAPWQTLEALVSEIPRWGIAIDGNLYSNAVGQFVITRRGAFFEVIVETGDAA